MKLIPYNLQQFRTNNGLSQEKAAKIFGIGVRTWGRRETRGKVPALWSFAIAGWLYDKQINDDLKKRNHGEV